MTLLLWNSKISTKKQRVYARNFFIEFHAGKGESIIDKSAKDAFIKEIEVQKPKYKNLKRRLIDTLSIQKTKTIEKLTDEWQRIIRMYRSMNEGFNKMGMADKTLEIQFRVTNMLTRIFFPNNEKEIDLFDIETFWSVLTWDD